MRGARGEGPSGAAAWYNARFDKMHVCKSAASRKGE